MYCCYYPALLLLYNMLYQQRGVRDHCDLQYHTALPSIFGVPKYAESLTQLAQQKVLS